MLKGRRPLSKEGQIFLRLELVHLPTACKNIFLLHLHQRHCADTQMAGPSRVQPREHMPVRQGLKRSWNGSCSLVLAACISGLGGWTQERAMSGEVVGTYSLHRMAFLDSKQLR